LEINRQEKEKKPSYRHTHYRPVIGLAIISLMVCGLLFPLVITGVGQVFFPNQSNGDLVTLDGCTIGSSLIAQNFNKSVFFFPRPASQSASGVDPDITLQNATAQVPRISNATGISPAVLDKLVDDNVQGTFWLFGSPYVDVLQLNISLIKTNATIYNGYLPKSLVDGNCSST